MKDVGMFMKYIENNFNISGEAYRLICNIVCYSQKFSIEFQYRFLCNMLDGTIDIYDHEIAEAMEIKAEN